MKQHKLKRLNLIAAPENIVFDKALTPYFLHYGVKESLPPYEEDRERVLKELKACAALAADGAYTFDEYLKYKETLHFSPEVKSVLEAETIEELEEAIQTAIDSLEERDKTYIKLPKKKWKIQRYAWSGACRPPCAKHFFTPYTFCFSPSRSKRQLRKATAIF
ncbi:type VII secretion protein EssB/YukC [Bacillus velezensis]